MVYITIKQSPRYHQMTLEEFYFGTGSRAPVVISNNESNTRTYAVSRVSDRFLSTINVAELIEKLEKFNESTDYLRKVPRRDLYYTFHIPKKSGGLRRIDAPNDELMGALRQLKAIFENDFGALYHTAAFAYVRKRSTIDAVKKHQTNQSKWFGKLDLHNFFGSTTLEFVMRQFSMVFPFSEVMKYPAGVTELRKALDLAFLNGVLPQGTPISPLITNIMMIPVDYKLSNGLRHLGSNKFVYTRYADDFIISSRTHFRIREVEDFVIRALREFKAPFSLNREKTRYGSSAGANWNLGVILNKDNEITVGYKAKRQFKCMLAAFVQDKLHGISWDIHDVMVMEGLRNYYTMVEGDKIKDIVKSIGEKFNVDVVRMIKAELKPA